MKEWIKNNKNKLLIVSLIITFSIFLGICVFKDSDYFWHIKAGEYMFKNGPITKDVFSWELKGKYWSSHEWLFEILIYLLKIIFGNYNILVYSITSLIIVSGIIFINNKEKYEKNILFTVIWIMFSGLFMPFMQGRPHFISFILFTLCLYFINSLINNENSKNIFFIPFITILWANFHGGSSNLGYILCFIYLIIGLFNFDCDKMFAKRLSKKQLLKLLGVGLVSIICTGINIHGFKMTIYPYHNLLDSTMLENIAEWAPTSISNMTHLPFFILGIIILFVFLLSNKKINFLHFALFGVGLVLGLKAIRFWPYLYIISSFFIFDYIGNLKFNNLKYIICFLDIIFILVFILNFNNISKVLNKNNLYLSDEMINVIKDVKPKRLFNSYNVGGELIYNDIPVFIDGRADLYSYHGILNSYIAIDNTYLDYKASIKMYDFDYYLVSSGYIRNYLNDNDSFELVYFDSKTDYSLYKKKTS